MTEPITNEHDLLATLERLRTPFDSSQIGKKPVGVDKNATNRFCDECGKSHKPAAAHVDFVGHAHATSRLLDVDPLWNWEPMAKDEAGNPLTIKDKDGNSRALWIRLTVCGMTRIGVGTCEASKGPDALKELIGDAIRNAGMRFGMALDLWGAEEFEPSQPSTPEGERPFTEAPQSPPEADTPSPASEPAASAPAGDEAAMRAEFVTQASRLISGLKGQASTRAFLDYRRTNNLPANLNDLETVALGDLVEFLQGLDKA